jgi:hypothetical protein
MPEKMTLKKELGLFRKMDEPVRNRRVAFFELRQLLGATTYAYHISN